MKRAKNQRKSHRGGVEGKGNSVFRRQALRFLELADCDAEEVRRTRALGIPRGFDNFDPGMEFDFLL